MSLCHPAKLLAGLAAFVLGATLAANASFTPAQTNSTGFVLQLGLDTRTIQITPEYKEAVLQATLPLFSDFARKLQLPVPYPLTRGDIVDCGLTPFQRINGEIDTVAIGTKQGFSFDFFQGNVRAFSGPGSYSGMQNKNSHNISVFFGTVKITREQAIQSARDTLKKLGIPPEDVFAEQEPQVEVPTWGTNTIARYMIKWRDPRGGDNGPDTVTAEVNAKTGWVESFRILPENGLKKPAPKVTVVPPRGHGKFDSMIPPSMNLDYAWKLIPIMFKAVDEYVQKLSLPIPGPLTTNNVAKVEAYNNDGWPHCEIWLTNGWHFVYRHTMVCGYYAPDNFFDSDNRKIHISDLAGNWNLTTNQAIEVVRQAIAKLDYPTNHIHIDDAKSFIHVAAVNTEHIPRLSFEWYYEPNDDLQSRLEAEVNTDSGKLESLYYDDRAYWNSLPPIDVPITVSEKTIHPQ
jgi:hypothetical protein